MTEDSFDLDRAITRLLYEIPAEQGVIAALNPPRKPRRQSAVVRALKRHHMPAEVRAAVKRLESRHEIFTYTYHRATWIVAKPKWEDEECLI